MWKATGHVRVLGTIRYVRLGNYLLETYRSYENESRLDTCESGAGLRATLRGWRKGTKAVESAPLQASQTCADWSPARREPVADWLWSDSVVVRAADYLTAVASGSFAFVVLDVSPPGDAARLAAGRLSQSVRPRRPTRAIENSRWCFESG